MGDGESPRRRELLRAGAAAAAGLAAFGWSAGDASVRGQSAVAADQQTTTEDGENAYAFSYDLQEGDRFRVESRIRTPEDDPATETIPSNCLDGGPREFPAFVVRAYRGDVQLGYEGLFVPQGAIETGTTGTTTTETTTTTTTAETTTTADETNETTTPTETAEQVNETTAANRTTTATTEAAMQDETTTEPETDTTTEADTETTPDGETDAPGTEADETTTETTETVARDTETTPDGTDELPEIRVGEWYRVTSMRGCGSLSRISLESAEPRTDALETTESR